jgi:hypothetical protein
MYQQSLMYRRSAALGFDLVSVAGLAEGDHAALQTSFMASRAGLR